MTRYLVAILLLVSTVLLVPETFAQTGSIRGQVTDARTGDPLVGANIIIVGLRPGHGAASDLNGMYLLHKLEPGEYSVRISYMDYQTSVTEHVKVSADQTTELNVALRKEGEAEPAAQKSADTTRNQSDSSKQASSGL